MSYLLIVESGQPDGARFELSDGTHLVGRGADCDVKLTSSGVSRQQLRISVQGDLVTVENLSKYGSQLDGKDLSEPTPIKPGQRLTLGLYTILRLEGIRQIAPDVLDESSIWDASVGTVDPADKLLASDIVPKESDVTDVGSLKTGDDDDDGPVSGFVDIWADDQASGDSAILFTQAGGVNVKNIPDLDQAPAPRPAAPEPAPKPKNFDSALIPSADDPKTRGLSPEAVEYLRKQWDSQARRKSRRALWIVLALLVLAAVAAATAWFVFLR